MFILKKNVNISKNMFIFFKYFEIIFLNISMERALRATEDRGINVGVPFCPWSQGGAPFFFGAHFPLEYEQGLLDIFGTTCGHNIIPLSDGRGFPLAPHASMVREHLRFWIHQLPIDQVDCLPSGV